MSVAPTPPFAAGSCVFSPQHYRPRVCRLCFLAAAEHQTAAAEALSHSAAQPEAPAAPARAKWSRPPEQKSVQQMRDEAVSSADAPAPAAAPADASTVAASASSPTPDRPRWPEQLSPAPAAAAATAPTQHATQPESPPVLSTAPAEQFTPAEEDEPSEPAHPAESAEEQQEEDEIPAEELADAVRDDVPQAPAFDSHSSALPSADDAFPFKRRSQSVSVGSSSSAAAPSSAASAAPPSPAGDRASLLSAIQSAPRLRRSSEQHPRPARKPVVDLNSELTWAIKRKQKQDPALRDAGEAIKTLPDLARHQLLELIGRVMRVDSAGPAAVPALLQLLSDRDAFVATYSSKLGASRSALESIESTYPATKMGLMDALRAHLERLGNCAGSVRRYTGPFQEYKTRLKQQGEAASSSAAAASSAAPGLSASSAAAASAAAAAAALSEDWAIVDSLILQRSLQSLVRCVNDLRKLQADAEGILTADLVAVYSDASADAAALVDLFFERCEMIYAPSAAASAAAAAASASTVAAAASASTAASAIAAPVFSQTSKSVRNFQTLDLALQAFKLLSTSAAGLPALVSDWSDSQLAQQRTLASLKKSIEASPEYKAHIAVSQRRGKWDEKEVVQLRATANATSHAANRKGVTGEAAANGASAATGSAAVLSSAAADRVLAELKAAHPALLALLQRKAVSSRSKANGKEDTAASSVVVAAAAQGSLEDDESCSTSNDTQTSELSELLRPLAADTPLIDVCQLLLHLVIPSRDSLAFRCFVSELLLPRLETARAACAASAQGLAEWMQVAAQLLHACVGAHFVDGVRMCIQRLSPLLPGETPLPTLGLDANTRSALSGGNTPLHVAAAALQLELCCVLIEEGANPLAINTFERTPLFSLRQLFGSTGESKGSSSVAAVTAGVDSSSAVAASTSSVHGSALFARYLKSSRLSDVTLRLEIAAGGLTGALAGGAAEAEVSEVVSIPAHRIVLCAQSEVLRVMLGDDDGPQQQQAGGRGTSSGVWAEAAQFASSAAPVASGSSRCSGGLDDDDDAAAAPRGPPLVTLPAIPSLASFDLLLRWLYTGSCLFVNDDLSLPAALLSLATRFMIEPLRQAVQMHLAAPQRMLPENVESLYNLALHCEARALQRRIEHFVCERYAEMLAARPSLAHRSSGSGSDGTPPSPPHAFLLRVLRGLKVGEMKAQQHNPAKLPRWKP